MRESLYSIKIKNSLIIGIFIAAFLAIVLTLRFIDVHYFLTKNITTSSQLAIKPEVEFSSLDLHNRDGTPLLHSQWWHKWVIFYVTPLPCNHICRQSLSKLQKIYEAYWKKPYLALLMATFSIFKERHLANLLARYYPQVEHVYIKKHVFLRVFSHVKSKRVAIFTGTFYLVNPRGKVIMGYPSTIPAKVIERDLS